MKRLSELYSAAAKVVRGDSPNSLQLLNHGVLWVIAATGLDLGSSWLMMSVYGPNAEGNAVHRALFINPTFGGFLSWLPQQWSWLAIGLVGVLGILVLKARNSPRSARIRPIFSMVTPTTTSMGLLFTWLMAFSRFVLGVGSNVAGMLLPLGRHGPNNGMAAGYTARSLRDGI